MRFRTHAQQIEQAALEQVMPLASTHDPRYVEGVLAGVAIALAAIRKEKGK